jgi:ferric-dicitrate binding protein FerR (iron transport regulator)
MDERIIAYFNGELSAGKRMELLRETATDPVLWQTFASFQNACAMLSFAPGNADRRAAEAAWHRLMKRRRAKRFARAAFRVAAYAASVALLAVLTRIAVPFGAVPEVPAAVPQELYVPAGQRARVTLPDGSTVWLNAGSTLRYPSVFGQERKVHLSGEGFFDVARNPDSPFIVSTDSADIRALGTRFNVYSYARAGYMTATVVEGAVKVRVSGREAEEMQLDPGQQFFYGEGKLRRETSIDRDKLLWTDGIYAFRRETLGMIIKKLELYYDVEIIVLDPKILACEYTGKFRQRDGVLEILRIIQKIHQFKINRNESLNRVTLS